jgi:hypothetical protein
VISESRLTAVSALCLPLKQPDPLPDRVLEAAQEVRDNATVLVAGEEALEVKQLLKDQA